MLYFKEAQIRMFYIILSFIITWINAYLFCNQFIYLLILPLKQAFLESKTNQNFHLIFTELTEVFYVHFSLSFYITLIFFFPFILYQIWLFIKPGLYFYEKKIFLFFTFLSFFLTLSSISFTFFLILPYACKFFLNFENFSAFNVYLEAKMDKYFSFIIYFFISSFFFFQFPIIFFFFFKIGWLNLNILIKKRKLTYLFILVSSILITPPDFISQFFFIFSFFFFYELCLFILLFFHEYSTLKK